MSTQLTGEQTEAQAGSQAAVLAGFEPAIRRWFESRFAEPTGVQAESWPRIAAGENLLATAPTGSG